MLQLLPFTLLIQTEKFYLKVQLIDEQYGKKEIPKRDKFDKGYQTLS